MKHEWAAEQSLVHHVPPKHTQAHFTLTLCICDTNMFSQNDTSDTVTLAWVSALTFWNLSRAWNEYGPKRRLGGRWFVSSISLTVLQYQAFMLDGKWESNLYHYTYACSSISRFFFSQITRGGNLRELHGSGANSQLRHCQNIVVLCSVHIRNWTNKVSP